METASQTRICWDCGFRCGDLPANCPRCGSLMQTARSIRRRGWLLIGIGGFLMAMMTATLAAGAYVIVQSNQPGATNRFEGGPVIAVVLFGVLGMVWIIGLASLENGIWLLRFGRRNRPLVKATLYICGALWLVALVVQFFE